MSSKVDYIQLHGDEESPERVEEIAKKTKVPLIKAIGVEKKVISLVLDITRDL